MSDTHRRHEALSRLKRRGPKNRHPDDDQLPQTTRKSHKQQRVNDRAKLRKEYLR